MAQPDLHSNLPLFAWAAANAPRKTPSEDVRKILAMVIWPQT